MALVIKGQRAIGKDAHVSGRAVTRRDKAGELRAVGAEDVEAHAGVFVAGHEVAIGRQRESCPVCARAGEGL